MPSPKAERANGVEGDVSSPVEYGPVERRGVHVDPPHTEAEPRWPQPVGECHEQWLAAAHDHDPVQLDAVHVLLEHRLTAW